MRIWVTGYKGRLGSQLVEWGCRPLICNVTDRSSIMLACEDVRQGDWVIHTAAWTGVDGAEGHLEDALKVNLWGTANLMGLISQANFVVMSTDYVFKGNKGPYRESDKTDREAVNDYGWSKLGTETAAKLYFSSQKVSIVRTTGLYGGCSGRPDFASFVVDSLSKGQPFGASVHLKSNMTYIPHLAEALFDLVNLGNPPEIIHIASRDMMSRYDFAVRLAKEYSLPHELINPVQTVEGWIAPRPVKGGLRTRLADKLELPIYSIEQGIKEYKREWTK